MELVDQPCDCARADDQSTCQICRATVVLMTCSFACALCMSSLMSGDAISDASSRLALQGGAVAAWSRGCLVVATWLRVDLVIVDMLISWALMYCRSASFVPVTC